MATVAFEMFVGMPRVCPNFTKQTELPNIPPSVLQGAALVLIFVPLMTLTRPVSAPTGCPWWQLVE